MTTNEKFNDLMRADDVTLGPVVKTPYRDGAKWHLYADAVGIEMDVTRLVTDTASEFKL
jgi:hypothetical protein